jgi:lipid A 3-O-deacylase
MASNFIFIGRALFIIYFLLLMAAQDSFAVENKRPEDSNTISFYLENDAIAQTDSQYTNGFKLTWISKDMRTYRNEDGMPQCLCPVVSKLPFINSPAYQKNYYFSLGQNMYTPSDTDRVDLIKDDRPYAGLTYFAFGFNSKDIHRMDTLELDIGIVGPHSYAANLQNIIHRLINSKKANGWANQLKDEPILDISYERKWRVLSSSLGNGFSYDIIPHAGLSVGNILTSGIVGGQIRFGYNVPDDFGTFLIWPGSETNAPIDQKDVRFSSENKRFGFHLFFGLDASAIARNLLLDGNTFRHSHSVHKKPFVNRAFGGVCFLIHRYKITLANVKESKEFYSQKRAAKYGSLTVSYSY